MGAAHEHEDFQLIAHAEARARAHGEATQRAHLEARVALQIAYTDEFNEAVMQGVTRKQAKVRASKHRERVATSTFSEVYEETFQEQYEAEFEALQEDGEGAMNSLFTPALPIRATGV